MRKLTKILIFLFCFLFAYILFGGSFIKAEEKEFANGYAKYIFKETTDEMDLGYGVHFHRDLAEVSVTKEGYCYPKTDINKKFPDIVNVLDIDLSKDVKLIPFAVLSTSNWQASTVRGTVSRYEATHPGEKVIAAINAADYKINKPIPASTEATISNGEYFKTTSISKINSNLLIKNSGAGKQLEVFNPYSNPEFPEPLVATVTVYDDTGNEIYKANCDQVNADCGEGEVSLFYCPVKIDFEKAVEPVTAHDIWTVEKPHNSVACAKDTFYGKGKISAFHDEIMLNSRSIFGISSKNPELNQYLKIGAVIRCQYEFRDPALQDVQNVIGSYGDLIIDNVPLSNDINYHPRTMIGQREDGSVVLAVVDGRQQAEGMYGETGMEMAAMMAYYGCVDAWNFDGGGSSTMVVRKLPNWHYEHGYLDEIYPTCPWYVTNSPSQSGERAVGNCLLVVVKVPEIKLTLPQITASSITLKIASSDDLSEYQKLYLKIEDQTHEFSGDSVTITNLTPKKQYEVFLYGLRNNELINLFADQFIAMPGSPPHELTVLLETFSVKDKTHIKITYQYDDPDGVVETYFMLGKKRVRTRDNCVKIESSLPFFDTIYDTPVYVLIYGLSDADPVVFQNPKIKIGLDVFLEEAKCRTESAIKQVLG